MNKIFHKLLPLDKSWHLIAGVIAYFILTLLVLLIEYLSSVEIPSQYKLIVVATIGFSKEWVYDVIVKKSYVSEKDFLYTLAGGIIAFLIDIL